MLTPPFSAWQKGSLYPSPLPHHYHSYGVEGEDGSVSCLPPAFSAGTFSLLLPAVHAFPGRALNTTVCLVCTSFSEFYTLLSSFSLPCLLPTTHSTNSFLSSVPLLFLSVRSCWEPYCSPSCILSPSPSLSLDSAFYAFREEDTLTSCLLLACIATLFS